MFLSMCFHHILACKKTHEKNFPTRNSGTNELPETLCDEMTKWWTPFKTNRVEHSTEF